jgi:hypothetical protein
MRDPELVARAQYAAAHLEAAWERWRALQGIGETPAQPVVGYVGYALKEPWGQPRAVIGLSAEEAERLADFLERGSSEFGGVGRDHSVRDHSVRDQRVAGRGLEIAQRRVPEQPTAQTRPAASPTSRPLRAHYRVHSLLTASYKEAVSEWIVQEPVSRKNSCRRRLGSGRPGPGPSPDS